MPKFFLPFATDAAIAEETYLKIRANTQRNAPQWQIMSDRVFAVDHEHNGKRLRSEVGKPDPSNGEIVIAIFRTVGGPFLVCTPNRGVAGGGAMLTDASGHVTLFENSGSQ